MNLQRADGPSQRGMPRVPGDPAVGPSSLCRGLTSACNGLDLRPMRFVLTSRVLVMCAGCRGTSIAQSAHLIERRDTPRPAVSRAREAVPSTTVISGSADRREYRDLEGSSG